MNFADREACLQWFESDKVNDQGLLVELVLSAWQAACEWRDSQVVEPVGWVCDFKDGSVPHFTKKQFIATQWIEDGFPVQPVYTAPPTAQINQQIVEVLEQAMWVIDGMEQNYGNLWQVDETPESIDLLLTKIRAALAATQMRGDA